MATIYLIVTNPVSPLPPPLECTHSDHNSTVYVAGEDTNTTKPLRRNLKNSDGSYINFK